MTQEELNEVLRKHKLWLEDADGGERADMRGANMEDANMRGANMRDANMEGANMRCANMRCADMRGANMRGADMQGANIDYSAWPLWCGSLKAHVDDRIAVQLLYHTLSVVQHSPYVSEDVKRTLLTPEVVEVANRFHRVDECGELTAYETRENEAGL